MKVLFAHGLASSGAYKLADLLRICLKAEVTAPDLPIDPDEALAPLRGLCSSERPDLVVGLSWGGFLALQLRGIPRAVINPDLHVAKLMRAMVGTVQYLSPRQDGASDFSITEPLCDRYEALDAGLGAPDRPELVLGLFATEDKLVHCGDEFETLHPGRSVRYPGGHLPTYVQVKQSIAPALRAFINTL